MYQKKQGNFFIVSQPVGLVKRRASYKEKYILYVGRTAGHSIKVCRAGGQRTTGRGQTVEERTITEV